MRSGPTLEFSRERSPRKAFNLADDIQVQCESAAMSCWAAPFDVSIQPASFFSLLRHDQLNCLVMRSGPTPEFTCRKSTA
jgi:hypothetical protein